MTNEELETLDSFLEKLLRAMGQMDRNEKNGKWEMPSHLRDELVYELAWKVQPIVHEALGVPARKYPIGDK